MQALPADPARGSGGAGATSSSPSPVGGVILPIVEPPPIESVSTTPKRKWFHFPWLSKFNLNLPNPGKYDEYAKECQGIYLSPFSFFFIPSRLIFQS